MTFYQMLRMIWIDAHVSEWGFIRRADMVEAFGLSVPQVSKDLAVFQETWPGAIRYDRSAKLYVRGAGAQPAFDKRYRCEVSDAVLTVGAALEEQAA